MGYGRDGSASGAGSAHPLKTLTDCCLSSSPTPPPFMGILAAQKQGQAGEGHGQMLTGLASLSIVEGRGQGSKFVFRGQVARGLSGGAVRDRYAPRRSRGWWYSSVCR
jgi:hypothetical protein